LKYLTGKKHPVKENEFQFFGLKILLFLPGTIYQNFDGFISSKFQSREVPDSQIIPPKSMII